MDGNKTIANGALYYPYIHIHDVNWLKANLLIFPNIRRMIPMSITPDDTDEIREFTEYSNGNVPLLRPADLSSDRSIQAQKNLAQKIRKDSENKEFTLAFGKKSARAIAKNDGYGFQIHSQKLSSELRDSLAIAGKLAWEPVRPEPYDYYSGYIEVHPRVGEAVMSTLAVACAQTSGLDIVGDGRSGPLHRCLMEKELNGIYETWLKPGSEIEKPSAPTGEELFEFILGVPGDLSKLSAKKLRAIASEREPIDELIRTLRIRAAEIPAMDPGKEREDTFKQAAAEVMQKWENDRNNLSGFAREFFSSNAANLAANFATKVADKTLTGMAVGAAAKASATTGSAGWLGSLAAGGVIGAGAGLVIGIVAHSGKTYYKRRQVEQNSPYRFLTTVEDAGVVLQSQAILQ